MVWVMSNKNMKEVFFCCKYNWLFFPFNVGLNYLFPLGRSVAFVILLFGDRTKIGPTWKGYWIKSQICHRFIYHRHLPPIFSDCLSQLMPVTEFFLPHQSASIQLWEYIYIYDCTWKLNCSRPVVPEYWLQHCQTSVHIILQTMKRFLEPLNLWTSHWIRGSFLCLGSLFFCTIVCGLINCII